MRLISDEDIIQHWNILGSKWGYNKGKKNGKRTAGEDVQTILGNKIASKHNITKGSNLKDLLTGKEYTKVGQNYSNATKQMKAFNTGGLSNIINNNYNKYYKSLRGRLAKFTYQNQDTIRKGINKTKSVLNKISSFSTKVANKFTNNKVANKIKQILAGKNRGANTYISDPDKQKKLVKYGKGNVGEIITENIIPEKIIREKRIQENIIPENIIPEKYIYEKRG